MGTRLAATKEAEVPQSIKDTWLKVTEEDTVIDPAFDGINCRVMRNKKADEMLKKRSIGIVDTYSAAMFMKRELKLSYGDLIRNMRALRRQEIGLGSARRNTASVMRFTVGSRLFRKATIDGDAEEGLLMMGQGAGRIKDIPSVAEVIERTVREAEQIMGTLKVKIGA